MSHPLLHAFFVGRATAEQIYERLEDALTDTLTALSKFDAQQREVLRDFTKAVQDAATQAEEKVAAPSAPGDLQETIDNLRAEIAQLKVELQQYRDRQS
jgi:predicted  nucleic acid-binding Zn-ribbon protein